MLFFLVCLFLSVSSQIKFSIVFGEFHAYMELSQISCIIVIIDCLLLHSVYQSVFTYVHTYIHTYVRTYIHTYVCTHLRMYIICPEESGSDISAAKSIFTVHAIFGYIRSVLLSDSRSFEQVFG